MKTYAVLGATGAAGSSVLRHLLQRNATTTKLNLYVRSTAKLLAQNPGLLERPGVTIFEATLDRKAPRAQTAVARAIADADYIFSCTGNNESPPRLTVATDTANAIGTTLQERASHDPSQLPRPPPTVVVLSSSCLNPVLSAAYPWPVLWLMHTALSNSCNDLRRAEAVYRSLERRRVLDTVVFAQPGSLMASRAPTGYELSASSSTAMLGYGDLGPSMVEMAERGPEFAGRGVGVRATGAVTPNPGVLTQYFVSGLVAHFVPGVWPAARRWWALGSHYYQWIAWGRTDQVPVSVWRDEVR